jgi:hypothetical protein
VRSGRKCKTRHRRWILQNSFGIHQISQQIVPSQHSNSIWSAQSSLARHKLSWRAQANRKVFHEECDSKYATNIKQLIKESILETKMWGKHTHISKVVDKNSTPSEIKRLMCVA